MHWMDYQKKLGLGFDDNRKGLRFVAQMHNYFANSTDIEFSRGVEITFCNIIGMPTKPEEDPYRLFGDELYGLQRAWLYLGKLIFPTFFLAVLLLSTLIRRKRRQ